MFGQNSQKDRRAPSDGESRQPLLSSSHENLAEDESVIFAIADDDETNIFHSGRESPEAEERPEHSVRFQEEVQVIGPPLKSTIQSREAGKYTPLAYQTLQVKGLRRIRTGFRRLRR
jgi:solute carrier family 38 (sodium-coupled neutral amino acid transporter), member 11